MAVRTILEPSYPVGRFLLGNGAFLLGRARTQIEVLARRSLRELYFEKAKRAFGEDSDNTDLLKQRITAYLDATLQAEKDGTSVRIGLEEHFPLWVMEIRGKHGDTVADAVAKNVQFGLEASRALVVQPSSTTALTVPEIQRVREGVAEIQQVFERAEEPVTREQVKDSLDKILPQTDQTVTPKEVAERLLEAAPKEQLQNNPELKRTSEQDWSNNALIWLDEGKDAASKTASRAKMAAVGAGIVALGTSAGLIASLMGGDAVPPGPVVDKALEEMRKLIEEKLRQGQDLVRNFQPGSTNVSVAAKKDNTALWLIGGIAVAGMIGLGVYVASGKKKRRGRR